MLEVPESVILDKTNILENQTDITEEVYDRQNLSARTLKWKEKAENEKIGRYIYYPEPEKRTECTCQPENKIPAKDLLPLFYGILLESPVIWGRQESVFLALPVRPRLLFMSNMAFPH